jgi:hypothetical protein
MVAGPCIAGAAGRILRSSGPISGARSWHVDVPGRRAGVVDEVSCAPEGICLAFTPDQVWVLTYPSAGGSSDWRPAAPIREFRISSACTGPRFCVAGGTTGIVYTSTNAGARHSTWQNFNLNTAIPGYDSGIDAIACPATALCLIGGSTGVLYRSTDAVATSPTWESAIEAQGPIAAISCPGVTFCAAGTGDGDILWSEDPARSSPTWGSALVAGTAGISAISCPGVALCVAAATDGRVIWSTDPDGGLSAWHSLPVDSSALQSIACPTVDACVAVDFDGRLVTGVA